MYMYPIYAQWKASIMYLEKVSTHGSLRCPLRLTWVDTFYYEQIICMSEKQTDPQVSVSF